MATKSLVESVKTKNFTFRITPELARDIAEAKAKCAQLGIRVNVTESLTTALERDLKALQKHIQSIEPEWAPGQMSLAIDDSANAHTKDDSKAKPARKRTS